MTRLVALAPACLLSLLVGCPSESAPERLVIAPDPLDVSDADGWLERPVTIRVEDSEGDELTSAVVEPSRKIVGAELSPSRRYFHVRGAERGGEAFVTVHDARRAGHSCHRALPPTGPGTARFGWTAGDNLLLTWSAGTHAAEAMLFDASCDELLGLTAPAIELDPGRSHALAYTPAGAPRTEPREARVYDLSRGVRSGSPFEAGPDEELTDVRWVEGAVRIELAGADGAVRRVEITLDE